MTVKEHQSRNKRSFSMSSVSEDQQMSASKKNQIKRIGKDEIVDRHSSNGKHGVSGGNVVLTPMGNTNGH